MVAVDTNVLVRFMVRDHPMQSARAGALIHTNEIWIGRTVFLETEWVLRRVYGCAPAWIVAGFRSVAGLPQVQVEGSEVLAKALEWTDRGMDFADALHLASSAAARRFATFDRKLASTAKRIPATNVLLLS